jgi:REP element-mobilizing transposase RayT
MARKPRIHFQGALYHVITRGNRRQGIFLDEKDFQRFLAYLSDCKKRFPFRLYAYALLRNHLHLLIEVEETPLSRIMQSLLFAYASYFNKRYGEVGHLFQGRHKAILCDKDAYLLELVRYIHLNPVRANIVRRPEDYAWTGHHGYLARGMLEKLIDEDLVLGQFSENRSLARRKYRQFVWEGVSRGHDERYYRVKDQRYLGEEGFIEGVERESQEATNWVYDISLDALSREVCRVTGIEEYKLYTETKNREGVRGRSMVAYLARRTGGYTVKEIADFFKRSAVTISEGIIKVEELGRGDKSFEEVLKRMEESVVKGGKRRFRVSVA